MDKLVIKDITVYTKQNCVYCVKAKALLKGLGLTFTEKSLVLGRDAPFIKSLHTTFSEIFMSEILENSMQIFIAYLEFLGHKLSNAPT